MSSELPPLKPGFIRVLTLDGYKDVPMYRDKPRADGSGILSGEPSKLSSFHKEPPKVIGSYEEAFRVISKLRADGVISDTVYAILWNGIDRERAADLRFQAEMKKYLPASRKSES